METFTGLDWQQAVGMAVQLLPGATIQWDSEDEAVVSIVVEPEAGPCELRVVRVRFFSTLQDHGWPNELEHMFGPGGSFEHMTDRAIVAICGDRQPNEQLVLADQTSTEDLAVKVLRVLSGLVGHHHWASHAVSRHPVIGRMPCLSDKRWEGVQAQPRWRQVASGVDRPAT